MSNGPILVGQIQGPPGTLATSVSSLASFASLPATGASWPPGVLAGYLPAPNGPSLLYQWVPGSSLTPDGVTIVAGNGGNWMLSVGARTMPPYTQATPLPSSDAYTLLASDVILYAAAGADVTLPAAPVVGREYLVKVTLGPCSPTDAVDVLPNGFPVENPSASPYTFVSGSTPAKIETDAACCGWTFDGAVMNLTRND